MLEHTKIVHSKVYSNSFKTFVFLNVTDRNIRYSRNMHTFVGLGYYAILYSTWITFSSALIQSLVTKPWPMRVYAAHGQHNTRRHLLWLCILMRRLQTNHLTLFIRIQTTQQMSFRMFWQVVTAHESLVAVTAFKFLFTRMRSLVSGQFIWTRKPSFTIRPAAHKRLFS